MNTVTSTPSFNKPHRFIDLGHSQVAYWKFGQGPDLFFVHGWPLDARTWRHVLPELSRHFTCHLIDLPGAGKTKITRETPIGLKEHAETIGAVIQELGLSSYALVAFDSGAAITRLHAAAAGDKVWASVMGNTEIPGHASWQLKLLMTSLKMPGGVGLLRSLLKRSWARRLSFVFGGCFEDLSLVDGEAYELFVRPMIESDAAFAGQLRLAANLDLAVVDGLVEAHQAITAPTLLIWGKNDPWFPLDACREMMDQFSAEVTLEVLDPGKLLAHEEFPTVWAAAALKFLTASVANADETSSVASA